MPVRAVAPSKAPEPEIIGVEGRSISERLLQPYHHVGANLLDALIEIELFERASVLQRAPKS